MAEKNKIDKKNTGKQKTEQLGLFGCIGKEIRDWRKDILDTLRYNPDPEKIVRLHCSSEEERDKILQSQRFLNGDNFRLQIGKMQEDGGTLYNDTSLSIGIEYMINHTEENEQSVVQICADVGRILHEGDLLRKKKAGEIDEQNEQDNQPRVLSVEKEQQHIEDLIKKKFKKKGKAIKVEIVSDRYPEVFETLEKWVGIKDYDESDLKEGKKLDNPYKEPNLEDLKPEVTIIPCEKPILENMIPFKSPLPIIQYLAYHAKNDEGLMELFYNTKPSKYIGEDLKKKKKPGEQYFDFYGMIEVGLRLYEVLNGISIQGGLGRQRVYDKIISLIVNGKDTIKGRKDFDCGDKLFIKEYPALRTLHEICKKNYPDSKFNQLYIELSGGENGGLKETEKKLEKKSKLKSKLKTRGYASLTAAVLSGATGYTTKEIIERRNEEKQEKFEQERIDMWRHYNDSRTDCSMGSLIEIERAEEYFQEQANVLMAEYNISQLNQLEYYNNDLVLVKNEIVDMYRDAFYIQQHKNHKNLSLLLKLNIEELTQQEWDQLFGYLTAEQFMEEYGCQIIDKYHIPYQKPYEHLMQYQDIIKNTLKYGNQLDISKYKTKEISMESELSYFIECDYSQKSTKPNGWFRLKIVRVYLDNGETVDLFLAENNKYNWMPGTKGDYSLKNGFDCMNDLSINYGYVLE